jgi:YidC/Oxa1 family membrane protein insertase
MERRVLLAISLSFLVLFAYQQFVAPPPQVVPPRNGSATPQSGVLPGGGVPGGATAIAPQGGTLPPGNGTTAAPILPAAPAPPVVGDTDEREIAIETQKVRAVFTNRGARLTHWILKEYKDDQGRPLDLIPESLPPQLPRAFSLRLEDAAATARLNEALYKVSGVEGTTVDATAQPATVTFELETADGLRARKIFVFEPDSFIVSVSVDVMQGAQTLNPFIEWGPGLGDAIARTQAGSFLSPNYMYKAQAIYYTDGDVEREAGTGLGSGIVREGTFRWAGVDDHYFISAVLQPPAPTRLEFVPLAIPATTTPPLVGDYVAWSVRFPNPPQGVNFYVGPKHLDVMRAIDPEFTRAIYFGMFAWLAAPLLDALRWVHGYVGDWGWSIVVLTILINLAMFPLRHKSVVSMRRMQELQPQMKAIQERYAKYKITDPERQKMNTEVMELYKSRGVNPASGCVPMLLTMPFLFAFYAMLGQAIEIRGERFFWINDLSTADPLYITPVLMGLTMFWQQKITPTTADPTQQKIMMFMPVMITVTMLFAPSGLVIYWLVSNVWAIGQQYLTNKLIGPARVPGVPGAGGPKPKEPKTPKDIVVQKMPERQATEPVTTEHTQMKPAKRAKTKS